ncbi:hypothetical protein HQ585_11335 [candidate division KSB1 bacterium]|nr:hypothetical protein [candidate division KSB1 bacterium]
MRNLIAILLILTCSALTFAGESRVSTMGFHVGILPDDNANVYLFPQTINNFKFVQFEGVNTGSPDYMLIVGDKGDRWGLYGGWDERNDFINIIKSLNEDAAVQLGVRLTTTSIEAKYDNNEDSPGNASESLTNKYKDISITGVYGFNKGDAEIAIGAGYIQGPGLIDALVGYPWNYDGPHGSVTYESTSGTTTQTDEGEAKASSFGVGAVYRRPFNFLLFENMFASFNYSKGSETSQFTMDGDVDVEDIELSGSNLSATVTFFNHKNIPIESKYIKNTLLVYGLGADLESYSFSGDVKLPDANGDLKNSAEASESDFMIGGPRFHLGVEGDMGFLNLRFGLMRMIRFYSKEEYSQDYPAYPWYYGDNNGDTYEYSESGIGQGGYYIFSSGIGVELGNVQIDLILNDDFWVSGPQMIFGSSWGTLGVFADVTYTFGDK